MALPPHGTDLADCLQVHRVDNDFVIIRHKFLIDGMMEGPRLQEIRAQGGYQESILAECIPEGSSPKDKGELCG